MPHHEGGKNSKMREHMLNYLVSLLDDAQDFSLGTAKASHAALLCRMEPVEIGDYSCIDQIDRIRRADAQRHVNPNKPNFDKKTSQKATRIMTRTCFNQNSCTFSKHMKQMVSFIGTYVRIALELWEKNFHIVKWTVTTNLKLQKTSKSGCTFC